MFILGHVLYRRSASFAEDQEETSRDWARKRTAEENQTGQQAGEKEERAGRKLEKDSDQGR